MALTIVEHFEIPETDSKIFTEIPLQILLTLELPLLLHRTQIIETLLLHLLIEKQAVPRSEIRMRK